MKTKHLRWLALAALGVFLFGTAGMVMAARDCEDDWWDYCTDYHRPYPVMDYVPQEKGIYDTSYWDLQESDCRSCHGPSMADRHHLLDSPIDCEDCHGPIPPDPPAGLQMNCVTPGCHSWNDIQGSRDGTAAPPNGWHHYTDNSASVNCTVCHDPNLIGTFVLGVSLVENPPRVTLPTPYSCDNCHWQQTVKAQSGDPNNPGHPSTYDHYDNWGGFVGFYEYPRPIKLSATTEHKMYASNILPDQCGICHSLTGTDPNNPGVVSWSTTNEEQIRYCQRCHHQDILHTIHQQDYNAWEATGFHVPGEPDSEPHTYRLFKTNKMCVGCHFTDFSKNKIILRDLDQGIKTKDFSPGTNIRYKVKVTVDGTAGVLYKVVATGEVKSLYKPDEVNPEWTDTLKKKSKTLSADEQKYIQWNSQIPGSATPGHEAKVKLTLKIKQYDDVAGEWILPTTHVEDKTFNIVP